MATRTYVEPKPVVFAPRLAPRGPVHWNLGAAALYEAAVRREEGQVVHSGPFNAVTTPHTGRSPNDKFVVKDGAGGDLWWGKVNQPLEPAQYSLLYQDVVDYLRACIESWRHDLAPPSLRPDTS